MVIKRSARCPLDISIDYSKLETFVDSLEKSIEAKVEELFKPPPFSQSIRWFLLGRTGGDDPLYNYYVNCYLEPLKTLSGDNFSGLARWRSFELLSRSLFWVLTVPAAAFTANIFAGSTPLLESLKIGHPSKYGVGGEDRYYPHWETNMPLPFSFAPSLHEMVLSDVFMRISIHSIDPLKLKRLQIYYCDTEQIQFTLRCQNLTHLYLGYASEAREDVFTSLAPRTLLFPHLVHLDLDTSVPLWFFSSIVAPLLDSISFFRGDAFSAIKGMILPASVTKVECRWPFWYNWGETLAAGLSAVVRSPSVTTILCVVKYQQDVENALKYLSSTGYRSPTLSTLVILPSYNSSEAEALETVDLQQLL